MIGSIAWRALMRRNFIYRYRHWLATVRSSSIRVPLPESFSFCGRVASFYALSLTHTLYKQLLEVALPIAFVGILLAIKNAVEGTSSFAPQVIEALYPANNITWSPLTFGDYVTAMQAKRFCTLSASPTIPGFPTGPSNPFGSSASMTNSTDFSITGIADSGYNWQVPFVKCDSRKCQVDGEAALPYCEYMSLGVAPSSEDDNGGRERAADFSDWLIDRYPALRNLNGELPFEHPVVQSFGSPDAIDSYVQAPEYGDSLHPKLAMAVVFEGNSPAKFLYSLRQNTTNYNSPEDESRPTARTTPSTTVLFASYAKSDFEVCVDDQGGPDQGPLSNSCSGQYLYNGILTISRLVDDYVMDRSGASARGYGVSEAGVQFVQFPTPQYTKNGFYATIQGTDTT
jgi:hypothetical protein